MHNNLAWDYWNGLHTCTMCGMTSGFHRWDCPKYPNKFNSLDNINKLVEQVELRKAKAENERLTKENAELRAKLPPEIKPDANGWYLVSEKIPKKWELILIDDELSGIVPAKTFDDEFNSIWIVGDTGLAGTKSTKKWKPLDLTGPVK